MENGYPIDTRGTVVLDCEVTQKRLATDLAEGDAAHGVARRLAASANERVSRPTFVGICHSQLRHQ